MVAGCTIYPVYLLIAYFAALPFVSIFKEKRKRVEKHKRTVDALKALADKKGLIMDDRD